MPKYSYVALAVNGAEVTGVLDAPSRAAVGHALVERDLSIKEVSEKRSILQFEITQKKVPRKELMHFSRQLSAFLRAGISIIDALEVIESEMGNKRFKAAVVDMASAIGGGSTFADAARLHPEAFPPVYLGMLESAEMTGKLDTVLDQLAEYIERDLNAKRKVVSALMYPAIVAGLAVVTVFVLAGFVLPRFEDFFSSLDAELPLVTRILLGIAGLCSTFWFVFPMLGVTLAVLVLLGFRTEKGRELRDRMILSIPVIGDLVTHAILERFCRVLSSMATAGVPLPEAMRVTADGTNNYVYKQGLAEAQEAMLRGEGLAKPISDTGLFPAAARQMLRVGEETGTLDDQLHGAAEYFERELDYRITRFTNLFEPAVIIFVGAVVGFVAIALVSAMYGIFRQVNV